MNDALPGLQRSGTRYTLEPIVVKPSRGDRRSEFRRHRSARGKGHEKVQVTSAGTVPFDDIEEAVNALHKSG